MPSPAGQRLQGGAVAAQPGDQGGGPGREHYNDEPGCFSARPPLGRFAVQIACRATDDKVNRRFKADRPNKPKGFGVYLCAALVGHR